MPESRSHSRPVAFDHGETRLGPRPARHRHQYRLALPQPGREPVGGRLTHPRPSRRLDEHDGHGVDEGRDDREPLLGGMRHEHEPVEIETCGGCGLHPEVGHADDRAPRPRPAGLAQQFERERRRPLDDIAVARRERPLRQQLGERRGGGQRAGVEPGALHAADALLQHVDLLRARRLLEHVFECTPCLRLRRRGSGDRSRIRR